MCPIIHDLRSEKQLIDIMFRFLCFYEEAILFFFDKISFYQREIIFLKSRNGDLLGPVKPKHILVQSGAGDAHRVPGCQGGAYSVSGGQGGGIKGPRGRRTRKHPSCRTPQLEIISVGEHLNRRTGGHLHFYIFSISPIQSGIARFHNFWFLFSQLYSLKDTANSFQSPLSKENKLSMFLQKLISSMIGTGSKVQNIWFGV